MKKLLLTVALLPIFAFASSGFDENISTLRSIPLVEGYEERNEVSELEVTEFLTDIFAGIQLDNEGVEGVHLRRFLKDILMI